MRRTTLQYAKAAVAALGLAALGAACAGTAATAAPAPGSDAGQIAEQLRLGIDTPRRPFAIVDKQSARLFVFDASGRLAGSTPVLIGRDRGDTSAPDVGARTQAGRLRPGDATTPAGRFVAKPGRSRAGDDVLWLDWDAAFAIHRVRDGASLPERLRRLASADPRDKRVSAGCVVVPVAFFDGVLMPVLGRAQGTVVVLPEQTGVSADARELPRPTL